MSPISLSPDDSRLVEKLLLVNFDGELCETIKPTLPDKMKPDV